MVNVAKDQVLDSPELPAPQVDSAELLAASTAPGQDLVTGLSLAQVVTVLELRGHEALPAPHVLGRTIARAALLDDAVGPCPNHLLAVSADRLLLLEAAGRHPIAGAVRAGASALVVTGARAGDARRWREDATAAGMPLLLLARRTPEGVVTDVLVALLDQQAAILQRVEEAHQILVGIVLAGGGLEDLCQRLAGFLGGAAMVTTSDGRVLAQAGTTDEIHAALALDCFDRTGRLVTEREPVGIRTAHSANSGRAMVRIAAGALDHGLLAAFVRGRELTADDVHLLERAATVAALAITKEQAVAAVESKYRAEFLRDALAGRAGTVPDAIAHAASLGWDIDRRMVVVVAETDEDDTHTTRSPEEVSSLQHRFARAWGQAVGVRDPKAPVMGFSQEVVALLAVPDGADTDAIMRTVGEVVRVVSGDGGGGRRTFSTGVSRPIGSAGDLPEAYEEALNAVSVGRQMHGDSAVTHFDRLGIFRLLALVPDSRDLRRFVDEALGDLATDEAPENADLRRTLAVLIDTNLNVAETARLLFFHYNTLRYRIAKLEKMLGPFTSDPQLRLTLALALKVHQMKGI